MAKGMTVSVVLVALLAVSCVKKPPDMVLPSLSLDSPAFQSTLEAYTRGPIFGANTVDVLLNGEETFPAMLDAIRAARVSVTFEAYIFRESRIGANLIAAMVDRCRAGVYVAALFDAQGSASVPNAYVHALREAGCHVVPDFRPIRAWSPRRSNLRNHRRIVVVDGRIGFTGGYGVDDTWDGDGRTAGRWRETNVRVEGPAVSELQAAFVEHWFEATGILLGGEAFYPYPPVAVTDEPVRAQVVRSSPTRDNFAMYTLFLQAISAARHSILISTPYLFPGDQMREALFAAVKRGVSVVAIVPSIIEETFIEYAVQHSHRRGFDELLAGGIQLHEYHPALLHTKMMVIDGTWATVGSTNMDNRSMGMNDELNLVVYDQGVAQRLEGIFRQDLARSQPITVEQLRRRPWYGRLLALFTAPMTDQF